MSLWKIALRNIQQRALASTLTSFSVALGVALVVAVLVIFGVVNRSFTRAAEGYNLIVGRGGRLEIVLSTVYHLGSPTENLPWNYYTEFISTSKKQGKYASLVDVAVPYCLGDNYQGYRVIGTTRELFSKLGYGVDRNGQVIKYKFSSGRNFSASKPFEAVVGSIVAGKTGLKVGDTFEPTHGLAEEAGGHKHDPFTVVGIMQPSGTPNDRALFVNVEGFFLLEGHAREHAGQGSGDREQGTAEQGTAEQGEEGHAHGEHGHAHGEEEHAHGEHGHAHGEEDHAHEEHEHDHGDEDHGHGDHDHGHAHDHGHHHHEPLPPEQREVTAILIRSNMTNPIASMSLEGAVNKGQIAQAVFPVREIAKLSNGLLGNFQFMLLVLAVLIVLVAGIGIMVSIYNSMSDRRRDIAVMRALGARRNTVMAVILLESILLSVAGGVAGVLLGHGLIALLNPYIVSQTGVSIGLLDYATFDLHLLGRVVRVPFELLLVPGLLILASVVGYLPAMSAYRTDVAKSLTATP